MPHLHVFVCLLNFSPFSPQKNKLHADNFSCVESTCEKKSIIIAALIAFTALLRHRKNFIRVAHAWIPREKLFKIF